MDVSFVSVLTAVTNLGFAVVVAAWFLYRDREHAKLSAAREDDITKRLRSLEDQYHAELKGLVQDFNRSIMTTASILKDLVAALQNKTCMFDRQQEMHRAARKAEDMISEIPEPSGARPAGRRQS